MRRRVRAAATEVGQMRPTSSDLLDQLLHRFLSQGSLGSYREHSIRRQGCLELVAIDWPNLTWSSGDSVGQVRHAEDR
jgi:hypothetical protein